VHIVNGFLLSWCVTAGAGSCRLGLIAPRFWRGHTEKRGNGQAPECHCAVHMEEIGGEDGRGLGVQELPRGRVGVPRWRWRDPQSLEYPADGEGADLLAELQQLALDALVSLAVVLGGEPLNERRDLSPDRWASGPVRVGPFLLARRRCHRRTVPGVTSRCTLQRSGQLPDQRGQYRPVGPVQPASMRRR
jgi:hypothetical protein